MNASISFPERLKSALAQPLPGKSAQLSMAHLRRIEELSKYQIAPDHSLAGVVVLIFHDGQVLKTTLITRSHNPRDVHSGQISFPGGRIETTDPSIEFGAYRELQEEVGISPDAVQPLGALTPLYIPVSKFMVYPFVAYMNERPNFTVQETEVRSILTPDLEYLINPNHVQRKDLHMNEHVLKNVPYLEIEGKMLWGATAMIIGELREILRKCM